MSGFRSATGGRGRGVAFFLVGLVSACVGGGLGCDRSGAGSPATAPGSADATASALASGEGVKPIPVAVVTVAKQLWPKSVRVQGSLMGDEQAVVGALVPGRIDEVRIDLGERVRRGDVLAVLETADFELKVNQSKAQVTQARAALGLKAEEPLTKLDRTKVPFVLQEHALMDDARTKWERGRALFARNALTSEEVRALEAAFRVSEARYNTSLNLVEEKLAELAVRQSELEQALKQRGDAEIKAPFDGIIQSRFVAPGVYMNVGAAVVTLVRSDPLRFRAGVPERSATEIEPQQDAEIRVEGRATPLVGKVTRVSPALELASRTLTIEIDVPNPSSRLRAGLFAEANIVIDPKARILAAPRAAVAEFAGIERVLMVRDGKAVEQRVTTGARNKDWIEIRDGVKEGDVIIANADEVRPGTAVIAR